MLIRNRVLAPFLHRLTYHIPTFLFFVFVGTLLYNVFAFPFSPSNRLKIYFFQQIDLDTGMNNVSLTGVGDGPYLRNTINSIPSAAGQLPNCQPSLRAHDLTECSWVGLAPHVVQDQTVAYKDWLSFNATRPITNVTIHNSYRSNSRHKEVSKAHFSITGHATRACKILFSRPISDVHIAGESSNPDPRFQRIAEHGSNELRLWSRSWDRKWEVDIAWSEADEKGLSGHVVCLWSDANDPRAIPALEEVKRFAPRWVAISKLQDGLVEGSKRFSL